MPRTIRGRKGPDTGASAVEYGLLIFGIVAVIAAIIFLLGGHVLDLFTNSCTTIYSSPCG
jgi:pilus assembly protein Flp/PilA